MKTKLLLATICSLFISIGFGQITLEQTYPDDLYNTVYLTDLGNNNFKYVDYACDSDEFSIYNLDHSPYMLNVPVAVSSDSCLSNTVGYITTELFDCDPTTIEYAVLPKSPSETFHVFRLDGTELFSKDSVWGAWCYGCLEASTEMQTIMNTPSGTKLHLLNPWTNEFHVYSLCGRLPVSISGIEQNNSFVKLYPNPSTGRVTLEVKLPFDNEEFDFTVYNALFQPIESKTLTGGGEEFNMNYEHLSSGSYFFTLRSGRRIVQTGKFILTE